jgi:hypothetical protein
MPYYNFATYADVREEWAIRADNPEHAKALIGNDPNGDWLDEAVHLDAEAVKCRDEFAFGDDDGTPAIDEITPDHWAWRGAHRDYIEHSLRQNIAAISGEFHTHRLHGAFYDAFGAMIDGFVGQYELCITMAEALTGWEVANGVGFRRHNAGDGRGVGRATGPGGNPAHNPGSCRKSDMTREEATACIARDILSIATLAPRNSDAAGLT